MPNAYLGDRGIQQQTALPVYTYTLVYIAAIYRPPLYLHPIRFVIPSNKLRNLKYGRSACGAERPIVIPSIRYTWHCCVFSTVPTSFVYLWVSNCLYLYVESVYIPQQMWQ